MTAKTEQPELKKNMGMDQVGKIGEDYLLARDQVKDAQDKRDDIEQELIEALQKSGRSSILIKEKNIYIDHIDEGDKIKIRKTLKSAS